MLKSTLKLFKALPIESKNKKTNIDLYKKTIQKGFVFSPEVIANYSNYDELINLVEEIFGINAEQLNSSFHKSWKKIKDSSMEQLLVEQLAHYMTTYGKENKQRYLAEKETEWGIDELTEKISNLDDIDIDRLQEDSNYIYIPLEKLDVPDIDIDHIKIIVIKGYTKDEIKEKLLNILSSGIALEEKTKSHALILAASLGFKETELEEVKNKEVKCSLYEYLGIIPENPVEFLRIAIHNLTGETLLIKDDALIDQVKQSSPANLKIVRLFSLYKEKHGLNQLSGVFHRFKPLFLAMKGNEAMKSTINRIRKLADKHHKPLPEDYLNSITKKIKKGERIEKKTLNKELNNVNIFRKARLAYALNFRTKDADSILYKIRNGKGFATDFSFTKKNKAKEVLDIVIDSIVKDVAKSTKGKKVFIPKYIEYSLPATEKQFTGYFPSGTCITVPQDMIFGIYWKNVNKESIDLDLSLITEDEKIGWDSDHKTESGEILFSGDMTDARNGASELFYIKRQEEGAFLLYVNYYNFCQATPVPFKIVVGQENTKSLKKNYMINPNKVLAMSESELDKRQSILGLITTEKNKVKFYFSETAVGNTITSSNNNITEKNRSYLFNFYKDPISLNEILKEAGAVFVDKEDAEIDLSPENIDKNTFIDLLKK